MVSPFGGLAREPGLACGSQKVRRWVREEEIWPGRGPPRSAGRSDTCISPAVAPTANWGPQSDASRRDDHNGTGHASLTPLPEPWWPFEVGGGVG
ncbi:hypothetical protein NCS57_01493300 [Fusarium keratoplasticum]|uniref:uncharacterized protein n=1 Tax=Fusarium keratoplasticum TaxID=1328300 RepID=UPI0022FDCA9C|nr:uncharacterized protein NCS57_01493300 [Fusarium keratoplasticum]KAI8648004.1 hypothetical protein NCS57_01493300 [Fusarium keratoplasticum]